MSNGVYFPRHHHHHHPPPHQHHHKYLQCNEANDVKQMPRSQRHLGRAVHQAHGYLPSHTASVPLTSSKLYCLVTEAHLCEQPEYMKCNGQESKLQTFDCTN